MSASSPIPGVSAPAADEKSEYKAGLRQLEAQKRQRRLERHARAYQAAQTAAGVLRQRFSATRVWVFGSVLHPKSFDLRSDIDMAAEGIDPQMVLKAWCAISAVAPEFEFDLITPDECRAEIWASVEAEGVEL